VKHLHIHIHLPAAGPDWSALFSRLDQIMTSQAEGVIALKAQAEEARETRRLAEKVAAETDGLLAKISALLDDIATSAELNQEMLSAIAEVGAEITAARTAVKVADDKVADASVTP
jgi:hypothetical protein